ncbi:hypothetical protein ACE04B_31000 [Rhizobium phaseoli]
MAATAPQPRCGEDRSRRHGVNVASNLAMQTAALENILTATREQEQRHELKG